MRVAMLGLVLVGLAGCSTQGEEDSKWVGHAEGRFVKANKFDERFTSSPSSRDGMCLQTGQTFEIRLQSLVVGWEFDSALEKLTSDPGNELGVFITVNKSRPGTGAVVAAPAPAVAVDPNNPTPAAAAPAAAPAAKPAVAASKPAAAAKPPAPAVAGAAAPTDGSGGSLEVAPPVIPKSDVAKDATPVQGGTLTNPVERRLVYITDSTYPKTDMNGSNLLVYSDTYDGSDYTITFEVVEFDEAGFDQFAGIARELAKAAQESGISANLPYSALLTKVGSAMYRSIKRNDKINFYKTTFLPCDSVTGDNSSVFMRMGDFAVIRVPQDQHVVDWSDLSYVGASKRVSYPAAKADSTSYMTFSIYGRK